MKQRISFDSRIAQIQKIENIDEELYEEGYDTDGDIGPFYDSVEHEEDLAPNIE